MKDRIIESLKRFAETPFMRIAAIPFRKLWQLLAHNFGLKLLSLLMAILMWNFVVSNTTTITRTKTVNNLSGYMAGQSTLASSGLALLTDPADELSSISVLVEVSQADFAYISQDNVQVGLDLSGVRNAGTQEIPLKATTTYGRVKQIMPSSVTLTFEPLDSRVLPVGSSIVGEQSSALWYNVTRTNPSTITISGAASLVRSVDRVVANADVTGMETTFSAAEDYTLMDREGKEISAEMITRSSSSVSVSVDVYPKKELPISADAEKAVTGEVAEGYEIESISIQPQTITVAGDQELLDGMTELYVQPVDVSGASQSFSVRAGVSALSSFRYVSAEDVYVNVNIVEQNESVWLEEVPVSFSGKPDGLKLIPETETVRVCVTGPISRVEELRANGLVILADVSGLKAGSHSVAPIYPTETYPELTFYAEPVSIGVTLEKEEETIGG